MIKSIDLLNKVKEILNKGEISEEDLNNIENLTLNQYNLDGNKNNINLYELKCFKNLKTLTLIKFTIDNDIIKSINNNKFLWAIQFSKCKFENIIPLNHTINYLVLDNCKNINFELINNNKTIKIIGSQTDLAQFNNINETKSLYLQDCKINNLEKVLTCEQLEYLNLDGSVLEEFNTLNILESRIEVSYKDENHLSGGI